MKKIVFIGLLLLISALIVHGCIKDEIQPPEPYFHSFDEPQDWNLYPDFPFDPLDSGEVRIGCEVHAIGLNFPEFLDEYFSEDTASYYLRADGFLDPLEFSNQTPSYYDINWYKQSDSLSSRFDLKEWYCHQAYNDCRSVHSAYKDGCLGCSDIRNIWANGNSFIFVTYVPTVNDTAYFCQKLRRY